MLLSMTSPPRAANNKPPRTVTNLFLRQPPRATGKQPPGGVLQDNPTPPRERTATLQPAPRTKLLRSHLSQTKITRSQNHHTPTRKTVQLTIWVKPRVKAEVQRIAEMEGLSISTTGAAFLEQALQQNIATQHAALLEPIINKAIAKHMRAYSTRLAVLLVRVAFASEQTRNLVTNILGRQTGITPDILNKILDSSSKAAKGKITYKTPQLESIIEEVEHWFTELEHENNS